MGLQFQAYWSAHGAPNRHAMELSETVPQQLVCMLLQRHVNLMDEQGQLHLSDPKVAETIVAYVEMSAGPRRMAAESSAETGLWVKDIAEGNICAAMTPDWRAAYLREYGGRQGSALPPDNDGRATYLGESGGPLAGKLRMMPMPRFDPDDAPTSTWSGTMIGIPKGSAHPDDAWKLIELLYLSDAGLESRVKESGILPPVKEYWERPFMHDPDPFFGGQRTLELYVSLADQIPVRDVTWATPLAVQAAGYVMNNAIAYARAGHTHAALREHVQDNLRWAERYVRMYVEHGTFTDAGRAPDVSADLSGRHDALVR